MTINELENIKKIPKDDVLWQMLSIFIKIIDTKADSQTLKGIAKEGIRDIITIANTYYLDIGKLK